MKNCYALCRVNVVQCCRDVVFMSAPSAAILYPVKEGRENISTATCLHALRTGMGSDAFPPAERIICYRAAFDSTGQNQSEFMGERWNARILLQKSA